MATWCLPKEQAESLKKALKERTITPQKMIDMDTDQRRQLFNEIVGERDAAHLNAMLEPKFLNQNFIRGMMSWANRSLAEYPKTQKDLISSIKRMEERLNKKEITLEQAFDRFGDMINWRMGTSMSEDQWLQTVDMARDVEEKRIVMESGPRRQGIWDKPTETEMAWGLATVQMENYVQSLKTAAKSKTIGEQISNWPQALVDFAGIAKSLLATADLSYTLRQGMKVLVHSPKTWYQNTLKEFQDVVDVYGGKNVMDYVKAEIVSDPYYKNMKKDKVAINVVEEEYPGSEAIKKIPVFGKIHEASETAYTAFAYRSRAQLYKIYTQLLERSDTAQGNEGRDTTDRGLGIFVNAISGRGDLRGLMGEGKALDTLNKLLFSPRFISSQVEFLIAHAGDQRIDPALRKQAAIKLLEYGSIMTVALLTAAAVDPEHFEIDPRSADFGKYRFGNTRIDLLGGLGGFINLIARGVTQETVSSTTGISRAYGEGYGDDFTNAIFDFATNKAAPVPRIMLDFFQKEWGSKKPGETGLQAIGRSAKYLVKGTLVPIPFQTAEEMYKDPNSGSMIGALIAEVFGLSANTYGATEDLPSSFYNKEFDNLSLVPGLTLNQIKKEYVNSVNVGLISLVRTKEYGKKSNKEKEKLVKDMKATELRKILSQYPELWTENFDDDTRKTVNQFKAKMPEAYEQGEAIYNQIVVDGVEKLFNNPEFMVMSVSEQNKEINKLRASALKEVFKQFGFKYVTEK